MADYRKPSSPPRILAARRRALTLIEVVVSTLIVSVMIVIALNALGAATKSSMSSGNRAVALGLADDLMAEILAASYDDLATYQNWNEPLAGDRADWTRKATVQRVQPANLTQATAGATDLGVKRIRVYVEYLEDGEEKILAEQVAIRTNTD